MDLKLQTGPGVFQVLAHVCRNPLEALKQFVENSADAIEQAQEPEGRIVLRLEADPGGSLQEIVVEDNGMGMSQEKMAFISSCIGDSEKLSGSLRGEKGIGILAFALIAQELHLCSSDGQSSPVCLVLRQDWLRDGRAELRKSCPLHKREGRGTEAHLLEILPPVAPYFTRARLREYLGREFGHDLGQGLFTLVLREGHHSEAVHPHAFRGVSVLSTSLPLDSLGQAWVQLYVLPVEVAEAAISLCGRGGGRICNLTDLEAFRQEPWLDRRLEGFIRCDRLRRTADKTAVVHDEAYKALAEALRKLEPHLRERIQQVAQEHHQQRFREILERVDQFIGRFLRHANDDSFFRIRRSALAALRGDPKSVKPPSHNGHQEKAPISLEHYLSVDLQAPSQEMSTLRSWRDAGDGQVIHLNELHGDYLRSQWDDRRWAWYLFALWAKEKALSEHEGDPLRAADEMAGLVSSAGPLLNQYLGRF